MRLALFAVCAIAAVAIRLPAEPNAEPNAETDLETELFAEEDIPALKKALEPAAASKDDGTNATLCDMLKNLGDAVSEAVDDSA